MTTSAEPAAAVRICSTEARPILYLSAKKKPFDVRLPSMKEELRSNNNKNPHLSLLLCNQRHWHWRTNSCISLSSISIYHAPPQASSYCQFCCHHDLQLVPLDSINNQNVNYCPAYHFFTWAYHHHIVKLSSGLTSNWAELKLTQIPFI